MRRGLGQLNGGKPILRCVLAALGQPLVEHKPILFAIRATEGLDAVVVIQIGVTKQRLDLSMLDEYKAGKIEGSVPTAFM
jgi:hypothetical protein